jgi:hypothetical protein
MDERLLQVYRLLKEFIEPDGNSQELSSHWRLPTLSPPPPGGVLSATDLLGWWFRAPAAGPNPWDAYFSQTPAVTPAVSQKARQSASPVPSSTLDALLASLPSASPLREEVRRIAAQTDDTLREADADAVVDTIYAFIHSLGRRDVAGAMIAVADDYCGMEDGRYVDKTALANQCASMIDSLHGWDFSLSLCDLPEPIAHPCGIIVKLRIAIDSRNTRSGKRASALHERVAVVRKYSDRHWLIASLNPLPRGPFFQERESP